MNKLKLALIAVGVIVAGLLLYRCNRDPKPDMSIVLNNDDQAKVSVNGNKVTVVRRNPDGTTKTETKHVPENAVVTYKKNGEVEINVKQYGWKVQPGIGAIASAEGLALSLDVRLAYWRRMGLNVGTGIRLGVDASSVNNAVKNSIRPFVALSYQLPFDRLSNTSVLLGYQPVQSQVCFGVRVKF